MHVLDYDFEYLPGYLDAAKFPEYTNKVRMEKANKKIIICIKLTFENVFLTFLQRYGDSLTQTLPKLKVSLNSEMLKVVQQCYLSSRLCQSQANSDIKLVSPSTSTTSEVNR